MCYYHERSEVRSAKREARSPGVAVRRLAFGARRCLRDDRGVAAVEGILVVALLAGVLLGCILLGQWGTDLQKTQMGARLLTFNAGDITLAKFGRPGDSATQTFTTGGWDAYAGILPADWLNMMFVLPNDRYSGRVKGTQQGRQPSQGPSLFGFSPTSMGYFSSSAAASNSWASSTTAVRTTFMGIAYYVGRYRVTADGLGSKPTIPAAIPVLESIYTRVGVR